MRSILSLILVALLGSHPGYSCPHGEHSASSFEEGLEVARMNNARRGALLLNGSLAGNN